jgi:hypothetical protein
MGCLTEAWGSWEFGPGGARYVIDAFGRDRCRHARVALIDVTSATLTADHPIWDAAARALDERLRRARD